MRKHKLHTQGNTAEQFLTLSMKLALVKRISFTTLRPRSLLDRGHELDLQKSF
jgi:hypothetical protein